MFGMPRNEIEHMLVAGTCNIKETTAEWLDEQVSATQAELIVYPKDDHGWFIPLPMDDDFYNYWKTVPSELGMIIAFALGKGCNWVIIDQAAPAIQELPTFDW